LNGFFFSDYPPPTPAASCRLLTNRSKFFLRGQCIACVATLLPRDPRIPPSLFFAPFPFAVQTSQLLLFFAIRSPAASLLSRFQWFPHKVFPDRNCVPARHEFTPRWRSCFFANVSRFRKSPLPLFPSLTTDTRKTPTLERAFLPPTLYPIYFPPHVLFLESFFCHPTGVTPFPVPPTTFKPFLYIFVSRFFFYGPPFAFTLFLFRPGPNNKGRCWP